MKFKILSSPSCTLRPAALLYILLVVVFLAGSDANASHFRFGSLRWESDGSGSVQYDLTTAFRRDDYTGNHPDGRPQVGDVFNETIGQTGFNFGSGSPTGTLSFRVVAFSQAENWVLCEPASPLARNYSASGPYTAFMAGSERILDLNNRARGAYRLETDVLPSSGNRSPIVNLLPIVNLPESAAASFAVPAIDPDGDPIRWRLSTSAEAGGGSHPSGLTIDSSTGVVTWNTLGLSQAAYTFWTVQVVVEDLDQNGQPKSQSPIDFLLRIAPDVGTSPVCHLSVQGTVQAFVGQNLTFSITGSDADSGAVVTLQSTGLPYSAVVNPSLPTSGASPVVSNFSWTPSITDIGTHQFVFSATDETGRQSLCSLVVQVDEPDLSVNYSPANLGQLKNLALQAKLHLDSMGGAGAEVNQLVAAFEPRQDQGYSQQQINAFISQNYAPVNIGQVKAVALPIYNRLLALNYDTRQNLIDHGYPANWPHNFPWNSTNPVPVGQNYTPANIGQLKAVFSFLP